MLAPPGLRPIVTDGRWLACYCMFCMFYIIAIVKLGAREYTFDSCLLILRTVCRVALGEGNETKCNACASISSPRPCAISSKSASFSAASWWIFKAVFIY